MLITLWALCARGSSARCWPQPLLHQAPGHPDKPWPPAHSFEPRFTALPSLHCPQVTAQEVDTSSVPQAGGISMLRGSLGQWAEQPGTELAFPPAQARPFPLCTSLTSSVKWVNRSCFSGVREPPVSHAWLSNCSPPHPHFSGCRGVRSPNAILKSGLPSYSQGGSGTQESRVQNRGSWTPIPAPPVISWATQHITTPPGPWFPIKAMKAAWPAPPTLSKWAAPGAPPPAHPRSSVRAAGPSHPT